ELDVYYDNVTAENSRLRAGTFGRGLWETDLYTAPTGPMVYDSSTTTQNVTSDVFAGEVDKEIIGIELITTGNENPIDLTSITFTTTGSTNPATDIANAKVYYTNNSATFATTNQFGVVFSNPNGTFTINGVQTLISGTNYFWLAYDIDAGALEDNFVDTTCTSITVDGAVETPIPTSPAGNRKIVACSGYCDSTYADLDDNYISHVIFNTIDNITGGINIPDSYDDQTAITTDLKLGETYQITIDITMNGGWNQNVFVYIDWNKDCDFVDVGESYDIGTVTGTGSISSNITVPTNASLGDIRMRIIEEYQNNPTSCDPHLNGGATNIYGSTEDYTLNILFKCTGVTTTWNGAWDNGTPDSTKSVIIAGNYDVNNSTGTIEACECTINSGFRLRIQDKKTLLIVDDLVNNGIIEIENEASLVQQNEDATVTGTGNYIIHKTTPNYLDYDYTYWSSPLDNETIGNVFANNPPSYIFSFNTANFLDRFNGSHPQTTGIPDSFDDNNDDWELANAPTVMQKGKGYIAMGEGSPFPLQLPPTGNQTQSVIFNTGKVNNGVITVPVTLDKYNQDNADNDPDPYSGAANAHTNINLIGNPYPSAIDVSKLRTDPANMTIFEGAFYFWTHDTQIATGGGPWAWNFTNDDYSTVAVDTGGVVSITGAGNAENGFNGTSANRYIASGQGFMANVTQNGNVTFNNAMRVTGENDHFLNIEEETMIDRFWLNLTNENVSVFRQILIGFYDTATDNYQAGQDAQRLENGNNVDFYSRIENDERHFAIQNLATFSNSKVIGLGLNIMETGDYSISINQVEGLFSSQDIYLFDKQFTTLHNLTNKPFRFSIFDTNLFDPIHRFEIRFKDNATVSTQQEILQRLSIYPNPSKGIFTIAMQSEEAVSIKVFDLSGKLLINKQNTKERKIDMTNFARGLYLVRISQNEEYIVKKLVLK
ncbi:MAG TPA: T9SS type A sorting domain-containing protein, partial [Lutibacter sp.]|nr:T9SS type A sorting domain-containing protein [Lutibacter sp.]